MKNKPFIVVVVVALLCWGRMATAAEAWKLLFSLQSDKKGVALSHPAGLYVDAQSERYYVLDTGHNRVISFGRGGELLQAFTAGGALAKPIAMVKKGDGRLLVVEKGKGTLTEIDVKSKSVVPQPLQDQGRMVFPQRIKVSDQKFYVLDKVSGNILVLDSNMTVTARLSCPDCRAGYADFSVKGGTVYALPMMATAVHTFDAAGTLTGSITLSSPPEFPVSLALHPDGGFLVLDRHANTVAHYQADGRLKGRHLGPGHKGGGLSYPAEIQMDPWGRVCIVDEGNGRVSVYQP